MQIWQPSQSWKKSKIEFDVILDTVTRANHTKNPPNLRFLLSSTGLYTSLNVGATPFWMDLLLKHLGALASWFRSVPLQEDFHSLLRNPPGLALKRLAQWFEQGALPVLPTDSVVAITTNVPLWQAFDRIKADKGYNPIFTFPIGASAM